jgi:hypothetical protein
MPCFFFSGSQYIRVNRDNDTDLGFVERGYPAPISEWGWGGSFGSKGISDALYSETKLYFFSGAEYIRLTRAAAGGGTLDPGFPVSISEWGWGSFGRNGIDAALFSEAKLYFFSGGQYIRLTRAAGGGGNLDPGYPAPISEWGWGSFGSNGIDAALYSGAKLYFFSGTQYIRMTRAAGGGGKLDPGYPAPISDWGWGNFGSNGISAALFSGFDSGIDTVPGAGGGGSGLGGDPPGPGDPDHHHELD